MKTALKLLFLLAGLGIAMQSCFQGKSNSKDKNYQLVWSDEFDYTGYPDSTKWSYDVGDGCPQLCGWGNEELQYYTRRSLNNARVSDGVLTIEVHSEEIEDRQYSSARLITKDRQHWQYGRFEIRARIPESRGIWSAIWMLPIDHSKYGVWPKSGEIDIMENVGYNPEAVVASVHTGAHNFLSGTQKNNHLELKDNSSKFHTYILDWDEQGLTFLVDDKEFFTYPNENNGIEQWPFDQSMYLILNIAYGGNWGGKNGIEPEKLPQKMEVDYVRVYQRN